METKEIYSISNGFASSSKFEATREEAIKKAEENSGYGCCTVWLYVYGADGCTELGCTHHVGPMTWKFCYNK